MKKLEEVVNTNSPLYQKEVETISNTQLNLLKAIANGESQLTSTATMQTYRLGTPRNVTKNRDILTNDDLIQEMNGKYEFIDPVFEIWFKREFFK